ncbi:MAG: hypothetical protein ACREUG_05375, partial [Steroidobacteraceae bacterium]
MRRALHIAAWSLAGLVVLAILLVGAVLIIGNTSGGRALIERELAQLTSGRVRISGLGGTFPYAIDIGKLQLRDAEGVWMSAERISLRWSPLALIGWDLHVDSLAIARIEVARRPVSAPAQPKPRKTSSMSLPKIDIDRLAIDTLQLDPAVAGMQAQLNVRGDAHYRSTENVRATLIAHRTNGNGDYEVHALLEPSRLNASLKLTEPAGGPLEHMANLPGLGALSVDASLEGPRHAEHMQVLASAGALRASANGTLDLVGRSADLTYAVQSPAMMPRTGLAWQRIDLQGRWRGPLSAPQATGVLDLDGLRLPNGAQLASLEAHLAANGRLLTMRATANGIVLPGTQPQLLQGSPLALYAALQLDAAGRPLQITVTQRLIELRARAVTAGARSATFDLRLPDVAPLAALYEQSLRGSLELSGNVAERGAATHLDVSGTGNLAGSSLPARLLGAATRLHLVATLNGQTIGVDTLELSGRALALSASGSAERRAPRASSGPVQALHARWQVSLPDLALISPAVAGSITATGTASGPWGTLAANVKARSKLSVRGSPSGTIEATVHAHGLPSAPSGQIEATGTLDSAPLRLDASLERAQAHAYHLIVQRAEWKSLALNGNLAAGPNLATDRGSFHLRVGRLADLQRLVGTSLAGSIQGNVSLSPAAGQGRLRLDLVASNVTAGGLSGNARLSADGPLDALGIEIAAQSPELHGAPASLATTARLDEPKRNVDIERFEVRYRGQAVSLLSPSTVTFAKGLSVRHLRLGAQKAVIAIDGAISPAFDLRASIHHLDAALVDAFVPHLLAQGTLNATARLRGKRSAPVGRASLEIAGLRLAGAAAQGLPAVDAHGTARFRGSTADVSANLHAGSKSHLRLRGRAPLDAAGTVALRLAGSLDAGLMNSFLEARGERAAGTITVDASVTGTAHEPQIAGTVRIVNGDVRDYAQGIHLEKIDARLVGGEGVLRIASLTASAGPGQL